MFSHIHMIICRHGDDNLEGIIRDIKKYTSVRIIEAIQNTHRKAERSAVNYAELPEKLIDVILI